MLRGKTVGILGLLAVLGMSFLILAMVSAKPDSNVVANRGTPTVDGIPGDPEWGPATTVDLTLPVMGGGGPGKATVRAAYDDESIYFLVMWKDPTNTKSIHKKMWTYDAATDSWSQAQNEDRVYFLWNINAPDFAGGGCAVYCHVGAQDWEAAETKMGTNNPGDMIDVWHWKATRTNPQGHADDKHWVDLTNAQIVTYEAQEVKRTRLGDSGSGFYSSNKAGELPKYMHAGDPGVTKPFLFKDEAVKFNPEAAWTDKDTIPGYVLKDATGSRADVKAVGKFSDGTWVVEFKRKLDPGNPEDAVFDIEQKYYFSLAITDNAGKSKNGAPLLSLRFE